MALSCDDENLVDYFIVATKRHDASPAQLAFVYPPLEDDPEETDFCENVTMFTYPHGYVDSWDGRSLPPPPAHNLFTLTDAMGDHLHGASLSFFETSAKQVKSLCLLSRRPFYTQLLRYVEQLFLLGLAKARQTSSGDGSLNEDGDAVEKALCNLFHEVPVPYRGLAVQMTIADTEIVLERPPFLDFPFEMDPELMLYTFMVIDPKVLLQLYHHVLLEHRILVVGNDSILVTAVVETLKSLVFPLTWLHVVVPNIPDSLDLSTLLDAPVPFLAGAHAAQLQDIAIPSNVVKYDLNESRLVVQSGNNNNHHHHQMDLESVVLPPLPDAATKMLQKLSATRLAELHTQKKELHQRIWDRRIQLQKCCMSGATAATAASSSSMSTSMPSSSGVTVPKYFFLVKQSLVHKKMMKLYLELMAVFLHGFQLCISHKSKQLESDKFLEKRPSHARVFYKTFLETAQLQSFVAQHNDYVAGQLALEDAMKFHFVHKTLLSVERMTGNQAEASLAVAMAMTKTFVATTPQVSSGGTGTSPTGQQQEEDAAAKPQTASVVVDVVFPMLRLEAFGEPRQILFPRMSTDAVHSSLGTFLSPAGAVSRRASKDTSDWMQSFLRTVPSLPTGNKSSDPLSSSLTFSGSSSSFSSSSGNNNNNNSERSMLSIFGSASAAPAVTIPRPAPFKRSRTIDRLKRASPFYRTMTQKALDSTLSSLASAASSLSSSASSSSLSSHSQQPATRPSTVVRSIWLITTNNCKCTAQVAKLTQQLVEQLQTHESKANPQVTDAYCALIHALGVCGHPSEAKAVFEECLSGSALLSLATIASLPHFWKPFSALLECYITNGLVQRAFDLLVQVQVEEEQLLDPSLGVLHFSAQVLSAEKQAMVERVFVTFSSGNLGLCLAPRPSPSSATVAPMATATTVMTTTACGCELIAFQEQPEGKPLRQGESIEHTSGLRVHDVIETINGEWVMHHAFPEIITALKQASRPMTVTFVRGVDRLDVLLDAESSVNSGLPRRSSSSASSTSLSSTSAVVDGKNGASSSSSKSKPRRDLCDRFGLLPTRGIRVTALADCGGCGARLSMSQVQSGWSALDANDYTTKCFQCGQRFVPKLCVMLGVMTALYRPEQPRTTTGTTGTMASASQGMVQQMPKDAKVDQFEYLSMPVIRKELSNLSQKVPLTLLSMKDLREMNPRIYWNIVVKLLSLDVPLDFMALPDMTTTTQAEPKAIKDSTVATATGATAKPQTPEADEEMRAIRALVMKRVMKMKVENQNVDDEVASVIKTLEMQVKQEIQAGSSSTSSATSSSGSGPKRWSLLGRLHPRGAATSPPQAPVRSQSNDTDNDDHDGHSSGDERETDVEDMRSSRTISVNESVGSEHDAGPLQGAAKTQPPSKPTSTSKFMPNLAAAAAPFTRVTRTVPSSHLC